MRKISIVLILILLLCSASDTQKWGNAPDFKFRPFDSTDTVQLSSYLGKPIVVNFWAVWCPYCVREIPDINQVWEDNNRQFVLIGIATDSQGNPKQYVKSKKLEWIFGMDVDGSRKCGVDGIPVTLFIDAKGNLVHRTDGQASKKTIEQYAKDIL